MGAYDFRDGQWTERLAGFALLANVCAARVNDDRGATFWARAATVINLAASEDHPLDLNAAPTEKQFGDDARCFTHTPASHDREGYQPAPPRRRPKHVGVQCADLVRLGRRLGNADDRTHAMPPSEVGYFPTSPEAASTG